MLGAKVDEAIEMFENEMIDFLPETGKRVKFFKESRERIEIMCQSMEDMRNQTLKEVRSVCWRLAKMLL
ncbi:hypothetical protein C823_003490 [Eubacterium plexicaudatum ASF492]|uniref:Uncharacterized protein n=1 Tax=Eubacterium plexicaudatum ASF492 TaxID=1235802 RepID=N2APW8_9FIRM|nr:hypothetical protein C823_003490 [Eubacterium plexicaudatum ASF492]